MVPSHTKFSPDRSFGVWKYYFRRAFVDWLGDLISVIENTPSRLNKAIRTIWDGKQTGFLDDYFKTFPGLTEYQQCVFQTNLIMKVRRMSRSLEKKTISLQTASLENADALIIEQFRTTECRATVVQVFIHMKRSET